ncbi:hypothetical protein F4604DRAFT_2009721 [Suillus subluteus]|nr:hypothetical protein F4604DRAFT_2009721 [Suillus subluteus]
MPQTDSQGNVNLSPASEIISALQIILRSQAMIPDIETPYSRATFPNPNHCAIELKGQSIRAIITDRQQQLDATLHNISSLETVIDKINHLHRQLTIQKKKIISSITLHKRLVSPLWRLPTEVLSHIFVHCLPEDKYLSPASKLAPVLLTKICRRWREVAVGTPSLWCRLNVPYDLRRQEELPFCLDLWLKRSRGRPLSLALTCCSIVRDSTEFRSLLQPYINQISSFSIQCRYTSDDPEILLKDLPALQELIANWSITKQCFSRLPPTLSSFKFSESPFELDALLSCKSVWANLTNVEIPIRRPDAVLDLLQLCPNLCSLAIHVRSNGIGIFEPLVHIKIQSLRIIIESSSYIGIDHSTSDPLPGLLNALALPKLRTLEVHCVSWPHKEFKSFLTRSNCPLETVILGAEVKMRRKQRAECDALVPSLEVLVSESEES